MILDRGGSPWVPQSATASQPGVGRRICTSRWE